MTQPANFSFAEEEPAPVNSLHGVISTPLPCPFCGKDPTLFKLLNSNGSRVRCDNCGPLGREIQATADTPEEAIARWNRRAPPSFTQEQLDALNRVCDDAERWNASRLWDQAGYDAIEVVRSFRKEA